MSFDKDSWDAALWRDDRDAEITRPRNELHIAQEWSARVIAGHEEDIREITALRAENERLRAALQDIHMTTRCDKTAAKARAALDAQPAPSPWRPIETAPKDGIRLLLAYQNSHQKWRRVIAFYAPKLSVEANDDGSDWCEYDEATDRYFLPEGWYECIDNWDDYSYVHIGENTPSHWLPLPPPPAINKEGGE